MLSERKRASINFCFSWSAYLTYAKLAVTLKENSQRIEGLYLLFNKVTEDKKVSRVEFQTRRSLKRITVALNANKSVRTLKLSGSKYTVCLKKTDGDC